MTVGELTAAISLAGGKVMIGFKDSSATEAMDERGLVLTSRSVVTTMTRTLREQGILVEREFRIIPAVAATIAPEAIAALLANPYVEYVEPRVTGGAIASIRESPFVDHRLPARGSVSRETGLGFRRYQGVDASITAVDTTWNIKKVKADSVWGSTTGAGVKLLILDTGTYPHGDLDYEDITSCGSNDAVHPAAHGLEVSGVAAALGNAEHVVGVAPQVSLYSMSALQINSFDESDFHCAMDYADSVGIDVINMSVQFPDSTSSINGALSAAYAAGVVLVGATGNDGSGNDVHYPASLSTVIAVGAVNSNNILWSPNQSQGSHTGPEVELVAPGHLIKSLWRTGSVDSTDYWSGTSMAAPHVAGAVALLRSYNSTWTPAEIRRRLALSALDIYPTGRDTSYGYGLLNIKGALDLAALNPASVEIDGPTSVRPFATCTWTASVSGGVAPLSYASSPTFNSSHVLTYQNGSNHGEQFTVSFQATGADWAIGSQLVTVSVSNNAPECIS